MIATPRELDAFYEFAFARMSRRGESSLEDLLAEWRPHGSLRDVHSALRRAIAEMRAGEGEDLAVAMESLRVEFGIGWPDLEGRPTEHACSRCLKGRNSTSILAGTAL